jgi:CheY-like chemotaxis protein
MRCILCIDDDERSLFIRRKVLEHEGYRVLTATSGAEGLQLLSSERIDAVVLDHYMPGQTGAEVAWELKRRTSGIPVLMLSSAVFCPENAVDLVDAFCAKIDGPVAFLELLKKLVTEAEKSGGRRKCILHVDDHEGHRYTVTRLLRRAGFKVLEAATGAQGLEQVLKMPDLVLLDIHLPDIDGFEVCRRIKTNPTTALIPVLHLTATPNAGSPGEGAAAGGDGYLVEPTAPEELLAAVQAVIERRAKS